MSENTKVVLSLKYRPQVFGDLIGQSVVSDTISNAIEADRLPNAYLFTGIRGVGKTTIARIVARSLNCSNGFKNLCKDQLCQNCKEIKNSNSIDCLEIDGASNTGVDNVRELIEFSRYRPTTSKFKIIIIDEIQMLSKQAFNALLKTLEEPPDYLKFIFCTTEVKKIPITIVSRSQRFDLPRIKSSKLFEYIKKITEKENGKVSDEALRLLVKMSEGSCRDALSLLDRALLSLEKDTELDLATTQKIFGYFDKSQLINLFKLIFEGNEKEVLKTYRSIYDQGVEPKIFINDFLELLYYFKNIESLKIEGTNFSLNDEEFKAIKEIAKNISSETLILFWQFTIKTLDELDIVSNQNLSIEMFLIRLVHLKGIYNVSEIINQNNNSKKNKINQDNEINIKNSLNENDDLFDLKNKTIGQIKNVIQEKHSQHKIKKGEQKPQGALINSFDDLLEICNLKKEIKLKYELEKNVNLVSFENQRIEISFNEKLDKEFIKILSLKLHEWTGNRWIITLSKKEGELSIKVKEIKYKKNILENAKKSSVYKKVLETFSDAELIDIEIIEKNND